MSESSKQNKKKIIQAYWNNEDSKDIDVKLRFDADPTSNRTWVNKDRFPEIQSQYDDLQDNSSLSDPWSVEFHIQVHIKNLETGKTENKQAFPPMTTVYGGDNGVRLFLKQKVIETVYHYEDSGYEILAIDLKRLYI